MKQLVSIFVITACLMTPIYTNAETKLYADIRFSLNSVNADTPTGIDGLRGDDNTSVFGVKGNYEENGINTFIHLQTGAPADDNAGQAFNQRFFFAGLSGKFGTVAYGRMSNIYKVPGFALDPFYNLSHIGSGGTYATGGATYGLSAATNGFTNNAVQYTSPLLAGKVKINAGIYIDDANTNDHGTAVGIDYNLDKVNVGLQLAANGDTGTLPGIAVSGNAARLYGQYSSDQWSIATSIEKIDSTATDQDVNYIYLTGTYKVTPNTSLIGSFGNVDDGAAKGSGWIAGIDHMIASNTKVYAHFSAANIDATNTDPTAFSIGAIHKFSLGNI